MQQLRELKLKTNCASCVNKCCSQPYDWVYLTNHEVLSLKAISGLEPAEFVVNRKNATTGHEFKTLTLPCQFLDVHTGRCTVYESRPLVCRIFPFYPDPLTGHATLLPSQCGDNLEFLPLNSQDGWSLVTFEDDVRRWLKELWHEAQVK
jgi:Fe-S-cluster containining protein